MKFLKDKQTRHDFVTYALCIVVFAIVFFMQANHMIPRMIAGQLVPITAYIVMAISLNLVVGIALIANVQFTANLGATIGLSVGACLAFALLTWLTAEGIERLDNPDMPEAFRGMPANLVYLGLVALALLGFTSDFRLI